MMDEAIARAILEQMEANYIVPELEVREREGRLPSGFKLKKCLVRLPMNRPPIVEFNQEIKLQAKVKVPAGIKIARGDPVTLEQVECIDSVSPPEVDGVRVAFFYAHFLGGQLVTFFDLRPNHSPTLLENEGEWDLGREMGKALTYSIIELAISYYGTVQADLAKIGLWAAPALIPYPLVKIVGLVKAGEVVTARQLFLEHCSGAFFQKLIEGWWNVEAFKMRRKLIEQALRAHNAREFYLSISTLSPHIEGTITEWLYSSRTNTPWRQESKLKALRDKLTETPVSSPAYRKVVEDVIGFILDSGPLSTFKSWYDILDSNFPNRHVLGHGRFDERVFTEENSAKLFLMMDSLHQIISTYSETSGASRGRPSTSPTPPATSPTRPGASPDGPGTSPDRPGTSPEAPGNRSDEPG